MRKLGVIRVVSVRREPLTRLHEARYGRLEAKKEGFPGLSGREFVERFVVNMGCKQDTVVTRIEFEHQGGPPRREDRAHGRTRSKRPPS